MNIKTIFLAGIIAFFTVACAGHSQQESTGEYIDDAAITAKVKTDLLASEQTSGLAIKVETFKGTVQLSGFADTSDEKRTAGAVAADVGGVNKVVNNITVK
jgi:osmotically-inducible protein OsmY